MKKMRMSLQIGAAVFLLSGAVGYSAEQAGALTRSQWLKQIGPSVSDAGVLRETIAKLAPKDQVEFAQKTIKAATRLPFNPDEKSAALVKTSVAAIAGVSGDVKQQVIAEVFAGVPIAYLPVVTEELAKRFDQEYNKLTNEQYEKIANDTLAVVFKRNAAADTPSVRDTFGILAFLRGAKDPALQGKLIALLPDDRMRNLATAWIPPALDGNYDALLAAADIDFLAIRADVVLGLVGHSTLDRLLADLAVNQLSGDVQIPLSQARVSMGGEGLAGVGGIDTVGGALSRTQLDHAPDYGINRVPRQWEELYPGGYQNQGTSVLWERRGKRH
ncbi:MAG: hypothetical protein LBW77_02165 [Verrucomicrobiota bacterium]|jgi:hypothetical protein|nr:hypothetical protein [Verrucomicrobiota bacterium]